MRKFNLIRRPSPHNMPDFDAMKSQSVALVVARESRLSLSTQLEAPSLLGEWFRIAVELYNQEEADVANLTLEVTLQQPSGDQDQASKYPSAGVCVMNTSHSSNREIMVQYNDFEYKIVVLVSNN